MIKYTNKKINYKLNIKYWIFNLFIGKLINILNIIKYLNNKK